MKTASYPLAGIRVIDFTRMLAGPYMTMNLADLGAEVFKVEEPERGDDTRGFPPYDVEGMSGFFKGVNRSKRSVSINLKHPEGRAVARDLVSQADILVENFRAGVMARYGLDYESLRPLHPGLIYCSITGYGHSSPLREVGGYDPIAQAESGLMELTGFPENDPVRAGGGIIDTMTGALAGHAVLAALIARGVSGEGQFVDISLLDCALAALTPYAQSALTTGNDTPRVGNSSAFMAPTNIYQCADGPVLLIAASNRQFHNLCAEVFKDPQLGADPRFQTVAGRVANSKELDEILSAILSRRKRQDWIDRMRPTGIVIGKVRNLTEALASPEVIERGMVVDVAGDEGSDYKTVASPFFFSDSSTRRPTATPKLGVDTDAVLSDILGYSPARIEELRAAGVMGKSQVPASVSESQAIDSAAGD
jgi:crotonobetainyl-CoA:carnitine CoA-transferase CaiB-like acyl-CoA transferase